MRERERDVRFSFMATCRVVGYLRLASFPVSVIVVLYVLFAGYWDEWPAFMS